MRSPSGRREIYIAMLADVSVTRRERRDRIIWSAKLGHASKRTPSMSDPIIAVIPLNQLKSLSRLERSSCRKSSLLSMATSGDVDTRRALAHDSAPHRLSYPSFNGSAGITG